MSYLKQEFIDYMHNVKNNIQSGTYCNALDNIERRLSISIDAEYNKDKCDDLYKNLIDMRKRLGANNPTEYNRYRQYASRLEKYIEFRSWKGTNKNSVLESSPSKSNNSKIKENTVLDVVIKSLQALGGKGAYSEIYSTYETITGEKLSIGQKAGIRATIERHSSDSVTFNGKDIFYAVERKGKGVWGLRGFKHIIGEFDSWEIVGENTAIKTCDKSFFEYKTSGVPKGICWFFDAEDLDAGESRKFVISYNGKEFAAKVSNDITERRRINISWYQDLATEIINYKDTEGCKAIFNKTDVDYFELEMRYADQTETELEMYTKAEFLNDVYIDEDKYDTCASRLRHKKNLILQGAPGVGKTFAARRLAWSMMGVKDDSRIEFVQFHQSYSYEDFIMGYKPVENGFSLENGIFYDFCNKAKNDSENDYFFIIDEINRGNMSKIFGELLMLIESDYRNNSIKLAYSKKPFSIPENLYIIGMMNTADRSLAMIDYALRRRFSFIEMTPGFDSEGFKKYQAGINSTAFNNLIGRIKALNSDIENDASLGKGFCIGHSYFCNLDGNCENSVLKEIVEYDIVPMLEEYWFDDKAKADRWSDDLRGVLNG